MWRRAACISFVLLASTFAYAQYASGFEDLTASAAGEIVTGQDGYYIPGGTNSVDFLAYTYAGNVLGIPANPDGGAQFIAGEGPAGTFYARAQRDINWTGSATWTISYDVLATQTQGAPGNNNIGSFSVQPYPGSASYIHLFSWSTSPAWRAGYLAYNAAGNAMAAPGALPGPEWVDLELDHWYRFTTDLNFDENRVTHASITDLTTGQCAEADLTDVYMEGGSNGGRPIPTGFRFFAGGGSTAGNVVAWDNAEIRTGVGDGCGGGCQFDPCDANCDGEVNAFDVEPFVDVLFGGPQCDPGCTGDTNGDGEVNAFDIDNFLVCLFP